MSQLLYDIWGAFIVAYEAGRQIAFGRKPTYKKGNMADELDA